jgi:hypothetical protein
MEWSVRLKDGNVIHYLLAPVELIAAAMPYALVSLFCIIGENL